MRSTDQLEFIISQPASSAVQDRKLAAKKPQTSKRHMNFIAVCMQTCEAQDCHLCVCSDAGLPPDCRLY